MTNEKETLPQYRSARYHNDVKRRFVATLQPCQLVTSGDDYDNREQAQAAAIYFFGEDAKASLLRGSHDDKSWVWKVTPKNFPPNTRIAEIQMLQSLVNRLTSQIDALYSELDSEGEGQ